MKTIWAVVIVVALAGAGYWYFSNQSAPQSPQSQGEQAEAASVKPEVTLVVGESIVGKWQSTDDAKFAREFKADGTVVDSYDGKAVSSGMFTVFTKDKPAQTSFPLEADAVYVQLTMQGTQADNLNFKVVKLTPDELQLVYMDRGGVLNFKVVK